MSHCSETLQMRGVPLKTCQFIFIQKMKWENYIPIVDVIFVTDGDEYCCLINKTMNKIPTVNRVINDTKIIQILTIISRLFRWLPIGVGSTIKRRVESLSLSKLVSAELLTDGWQVGGTVVSPLKEMNLMFLKRKHHTLTLPNLWCHWEYEVRVKTEHRTGQKRFSCAHLCYGC